MVTHFHSTERFALRRALTGLAVIVCGCFVSAAGAQTTTGGIRGTVRDSTGGVLAGVTVEGSSPALIGGSAVNVTNSDGLYRFEGLTIGIYTFKFTLQGFKTVSRENVRVEVGRTIDLDGTLEVGTVEETMTVSAGAPVVDSLHAGTSTTFNQEMLDSLPAARTSWFNTVNFAPAMRADLENFGSANFIMYGSDVNQNSYQFEGIDYNAPSSSSMFDRPNPDTMQELQVKAVGTSAEEYGFQGGVVNMIVKEGSNRFKGMVSEYYIGDKTTSNNQPGVALPFRIGYLYDTTVMAGGAIINDRLWFNGAFEDFRNRQVNPGVVLETAPKTRRDKPTYKVSAKLTPHDVIDFSHTDNYHDIAPAATIQNPPVTAIKDVGHAPAYAGHWTRTIGSKTVFEVKGGGLHVGQLDPPHSDNFTDSGHFDLGTGIASVNARFPSTNIANNYTVAATLGHYADDFVHGSHDLKFGVQIVPRRDDVFSSLVINNIFYYDLNGAPYYALKRQPLALAGRERAQGAFAQDNWTLNDRATVNLGVRIDRKTESVPEAAFYDAHSEPSGETIGGLPGNIWQFTNASPRVGLTYKMDQTGRTVAKASYGRYYGRISIQNFRDISPGNVISSYFYYNPATRQYDVPYFTVNPNGNYSVDPDTKNPYTDQFSVSLERQLAPSLGLELSFVVKKESDWIRVTDTRGVYTTQNFRDPFNGQNLTVYNRTSSSASSLFTATNPPGYDQNYKTFIVSVNKRLSAKWQLLSSYQYEDSRGNNGGAQGVASQSFSNTGPNGFGRDPNDLTNSYGPFFTSNAHTVRASGSYELPRGFSFAAMESFESGRPYGRLVTVLGLNQGSRSVLAEPRGNYHLGSTNNIQLRIAKAIKITPTKRIRLSLDAYNIFNADTPLTVQNNSTQNTYGRILTIYTPRRFQLGARYEF